MSDGGKGSAPRPYSVPSDQFTKNWESIFGKKLQCKHIVWSHEDGEYFCMGCGIRNEKGPHEQK